MTKQRGNILFLILLAIILFVALTYAVNSGMRGGGKDAGPEKYRTMASQLIQFGSLVENAVVRARTVGNVPEWGLDFNDGASAPSIAAANGSCTAAECRIFNTAGSLGQVNSLKFGEEFIDPRYRTANASYGGGAGTETRFWMLQIPNIGTDLPDMVMVIPGLKPEICKAVNEALWSSATNPDVFYPVAPTQYSGTLTSLISSTANVYAAFFSSRNAGCGGREAGGPYGGDFFQVVLPR